MTTYKCFYCASKLTVFEDAVNHHVSLHSSEPLKLLRKTNINKSYKLRTYHSFIPSQLNEQGKVFQIHNEDIIVCKRSESTPHKIVKKSKSPYSPQDQQLKQDVLLQASERKSKRSLFDSSDENSVSTVNVYPRDENSDSDLETVTRLIPKVLKNLKKAGREESFAKFIKLSSEDRFPLDNIAFLLFLDVVNFFSATTTTQMKYEYPETLQFWNVGLKLFHRRFLRFMSGPKNQGQLIQGQTYRGCYDPQYSKINFAVPSVNVVRKHDEYGKDEMKPGVFRDTIQLLATLDRSKTYKIAVDGKKISKGRGKEMGDIDLFGFETPLLSERLSKFQKEKEVVKSLTEILDGQHGRTLTDIASDTKSICCNTTKQIISFLAQHTRLLRDVKLSLQRSLVKFSNMAEKEGKDWRKTGFVNIISSLRTSLYDTNSCIKKILHLVDDMGFYLATMNDVQHLYATNSTVDLQLQGNYYELRDNGKECNNPPKFVKQRSEKWHKLRTKGKITGSTCHAAIGLDTLKKQQTHFDAVVHGSRKEEHSDIQLRNMRYGTENEINVVATLVSKILPVYFPSLKYIEEGCYILQYNENDFMVVSPDGSIRRSVEVDATLGFEAKCKVPNPNLQPVYYQIPQYYILQILSEMKVLEVQSLIFICWSPESSVVFNAKFDDSLWEQSWKVMTEIYGNENPKRPSRKGSHVQDLKALLKSYGEENVEVIGEFPSVFASNVNRTHSSTVTRETNDIETMKPHISPEVLNYQKKRVSLEDVQSTLHDVIKNMDTFYQLTRSLATEVLVFVMTDLDRVIQFEQTNTHIIAYGMKGPSLKTDTYRSMLMHVMSECISRNLHVPVVTSDSAFQRVAVRDSKDAPLTLLQLQKDVWMEVKKLQKTAIVAKLKRLNKFDENRISVAKHGTALIIQKQTMGRSSEDAVYLSSNTRSMIIQHFKHGHISHVQEEEDNENQVDVDQIFNFIPSEILDAVDEDVLDAAEKLLREGIDTGAIDANLDHTDMFEDSNTLADALVLLEEDPVNESTVSDVIAEERKVGDKEQTYVLSREDFGLILQHLKLDRRITEPNKWSDTSLETFCVLFEDTGSIGKNFTKMDLRVCLESVVHILKSNAIAYGLSWPKYKLVNLFYCLTKGLPTTGECTSRQKKS